MSEHSTSELRPLPNNKSEDISNLGEQLLIIVYTGMLKTKNKHLQCSALPVPPRHEQVKILRYYLLIMT